jgi:DNA polymerase-3 subunit delta'
MDITWHSQFAQAWRDRIRHGRTPHAVLLAGPPGIGKRAAAAWIARGRLGIGEQPALPQFPFERPEHADLHWLEPPEDKQGVLIEQVRELVSNLQLTSYEGRGKVAVIEPANTMTTSAANSLLKTLEEPPGDALLILVADRIGRLPPTTGARWAEALRDAGNAPLAAIDALENLDTLATMSRELGAVGRGKLSPVETAERWSKLEPGFVLDWLARQLRQGALALAGGRDRAPGLAIDESVLKRMDRRNLFCYLDRINRLRGQPKGSYNVQLTLESLLIDWAEGLADAGSDREVGGMRLMPAQR